MAVYRYRAIDATGRVVDGEMEADTSAGAIERLHHQGHIPVRAELKIGGGQGGWLQKEIFVRKRISRSDLVYFTTEIATLLEAGIELDRALEILITLSKKKALSRVLAEVRDDVRGGRSFADALAVHEEQFSRLYVGMVRAGEIGGALQAVFSSLADFLQRSHDTRETVKSALVYPVVLLIAAGLSVVFLVSVVMPQFEPFFEGAGHEPPLVTRVVIGFGKALRAYWWLAVIGGVGAIAILRRWLRNAHARLRWDGALLRFPQFGPLLLDMDVARFNRTLGTLLANGVPMVQALLMARDAVVNSVVALRLGEIADAVKEGANLADTISDSHQFPEHACQLLHVGEESGRLEDMMIRVADIFDQQVQRRIQRLLVLLTPALTISLGLLVAVIVSSIFSAILSVNRIAF